MSSRKVRLGPSLTARSDSASRAANTSYTAACTYTRSMLMQSCPLLEVIPRTAPGTARRRLASGSTSRAFLPPSSIELSLSRSAAMAATLRPVAVDPVNMR